MCARVCTRKLVANEQFWTAKLDMRVLFIENSLPESFSNIAIIMFIALDRHEIYREKTKFNRIGSCGRCFFVCSFLRLHLITRLNFIAIKLLFDCSFAFAFHHLSGKNIPFFESDYFLQQNRISTEFPRLHRHTLNLILLIIYFKQNLSLSLRRLKVHLFGRF